MDPFFGPGLCEAELRLEAAFFGVSFEDLGADFSPLVLSDFAAIVY